MSYSARSDLALEAHEMFKSSTREADEIEGVGIERQTPFEDISITRVNIESSKGEAILKKPKGKYITIEFSSDAFGEQTVYENLCQICAKEIRRIISPLQSQTVLVVGLGNRNITPDALGPCVIDSLLVTRHLIEYMPEEIDRRLNPLCAVAPGVLGITGIETFEIVKGICDRVKPSVLIVIDALCSRKMHRLNTTVQISNTGITPGAGIGNFRSAINQNTLGIPVVSIGVPTVVDAATITGDTIDLVVRNLKNNSKENSPLYKMLSTIEEDDKYPLIKQILSDDIGDFIVTPKEIDRAVEDISSIIANGINIAVHEGITLSDIDRYK